MFLNGGMHGTMIKEHGIIEPDKIKTCPTCKEAKPASEWYQDKNSKSGLFAYCIKCVKARPSYDVQLRQRVVNKLGGKCLHCGFSDIRALQIDHVNGGGNQEFKKQGNRAVYAKIDKGKELEKYQI